MSKKFVTETLDERAEKWETSASFDAFDPFYAHALAFKKADAKSLLRVYIPDRFPSTEAELKKIADLGIARL